MKGVWKTVESVVAGTIILLFVTALGSTYLQPSSLAPVHGYRALQAVYEKGTLRPYAADMNYSAINSAVKDTGYLLGYNHSVQICDEQGACTGQVPNKDNIWASSIILSGDREYEPVEVILYVFKN